MRTNVIAAIVTVVLLTCGGAALAQGLSEEARRAELQSLSSRLNYQKGQMHLRGGLATIDLTESFRYLDTAGAETLLVGMWGNPAPSRKPLGVIVPADFDPFARNAWCVVVDYEESGYVSDADAESIDYAGLLLEMQEQARAESGERVKDGYPSIELLGWATAPRYDSQSHKLYWAKEIKFGDARGENTLNYNLRVLGRRGVLLLNAVAGISQLPVVERATPEILSMVDFDAGNRYSDYTAGTDKVASYGLAALVAGGVAAKTGLLKALFVGLLAMKKFILLGVVALIGFVRRLMGRRAAETPATVTTTMDVTSDVGDDELPK